jgi:hypothetical protein
MQHNDLGKVRNDVEDLLELELERGSRDFFLLVKSTMYRVFMPRNLRLKR